MHWKRFVHCEHVLARETEQVVTNAEISNIGLEEWFVKYGARLQIFQDGESISDNMPGVATSKDLFGPNMHLL